MNARSRAFLGGGNHIEAQVRRDVDLCAGRQMQLSVAGFDVGEPIDVELEHLRRVLHAQPIPGTQLLIDPDAKRLTHRLETPRKPLQRCLAYEPG